MDDLAFLRSRIPAYADYGDGDARHLVDKQVRAYMGEVLSLIRERLVGKLSPAVADQLEEVLLMCEFTNQQFVHKLDHTALSNDDVEHLHVVDHDLVEAADRGAAIEPTTLAGYLTEVEGLFGRRARAIVSPAA